MNGKQSKKLKADEQIRVRRYAVEQITQKGARVEDVAKALGYGRSTVFWWVQKYSQSGIGELETKLRSGRPPKLDKRQREKLAKLIIGRDPRQLRFAFALWTREMIAEL
ncbi:MAG: helix-turn-helix domain-containing protein, partial [Acidimicrobiaceae bacterium]|nr:helix-turn-helix domain-containing protein [Acidimicrobiaceae bacterium]